MKLLDFDGETHVKDGAELQHRLESVRDGDFGAFILIHGPESPSLWIHINKEVAYLHFFLPEGVNHPDYQPTDMMPTKSDEVVEFLMVGDSIEMPRETLVPIELAYRAALEFFQERVMPPSISWFEL